MPTGFLGSSTTLPSTLSQWLLHGPCYASTSSNTLTSSTSGCTCGFTAKLFSHKSFCCRLCLKNQVCQALFRLWFTLGAVSSNLSSRVQALLLGKEVWHRSFHRSTTSRWRWSTPLLKALVRESPPKLWAWSTITTHLRWDCGCTLLPLCCFCSWVCILTKFSQTNTDRDYHHCFSVALGSGAAAAEPIESSMKTNFSSENH